MNFDKLENISIKMMIISFTLLFIFVIAVVWSTGKIQGIFIKLIITDIIIFVFFSLIWFIIEELK